jgi:RNA polymerase sigma-70 factor (ECF subfamily)
MELASLDERDPITGRSADGWHVGVDAADAFLVRVDLADAIVRAMARVPEPFRLALQLVDVEDQSYEAAAKELGVPVGTLRSRLFRGRRVMQELLATYARDLGMTGRTPRGAPPPLMAAS